MTNIDLQYSNENILHIELSRLIIHASLHIKVGHHFSEVRQCVVVGVVVIGVVPGLVVRGKGGVVAAEGKWARQQLRHDGMVRDECCQCVELLCKALLKKTLQLNIVVRKPFG